MSATAAYAETLHGPALRDFKALPANEQRQIAQVARQHRDGAGRTFLEVRCLPPIQDYLRKPRR
jgi:hypothetical protein